MEIIKTKDKIIVNSPSDFDVVQTLCCGQIFRFTISGDRAKVCSQNKMAKLKFDADKIEIETDDVDFFYNFFDFSTDYTKIKEQLSLDPLLKPAIQFAPGIRIINNDAYEMIISFIISANNNIKRIQKSIEYLCEHFGKNMGEYHAFPTLEELKTATVQDFVTAGLGYRAEQMFDTVQKLTMQDVEEMKSMPTAEIRQKLISYKGIGEKVANCILLFGFGTKDVFPVDTWINKVYNDIYKVNETNRQKITRLFTEKYGNLAGYAQQYFFYYYRSNKGK